MDDTMRLYHALFGNRAYLRSVCEGAAFLAASTIAIFAAVTYATVHASNPVTDLVLSRVGPLNVRFLFVYGTFTAFAITAGLLAWRPNRLPFALKATALFLLVRAVFVALTHIGPSPIDPQQPAPFFNSIFFGSDLFFSGHTGLPFLAALAFWHVAPWRTFYLALTAFFGAIVLLGHYHYSIDVLAALFITHGVFQISCWLFGRDYALFRSSESQAVPRKKRTTRRRLFAIGGPGRGLEPFAPHAVGEGPVSEQPSGGWTANYPSLSPDRTAENRSEPERSTADNSWGAAQLPRIISSATPRDFSRRDC